jgi:hypothetical protein
MLTSAWIVNRIQLGRRIQAVDLRPYKVDAASKSETLFSQFLSPSIPSALNSTAALEETTISTYQLHLKTSTLEYVTMASFFREVGRRNGRLHVAAMPISDGVIRHDPMHPFHQYDE